MASPVDFSPYSDSSYVLKQNGWGRRSLTEADLIKLCKAFGVRIFREEMKPQGVFLTQNGRPYILINQRLTNSPFLFVAFHCLAHAMGHDFFLDLTCSAIPEPKIIYATCHPLDDLQNHIIPCGSHGAYASIFASIALMPRLSLVDATSSLFYENTRLYDSFIRYRQVILRQYGQ